MLPAGIGSATAAGISAPAPAVPPPRAHAGRTVPQDLPTVEVEESPPDVEPGAEANGAAESEPEPVIEIQGDEEEGAAAASSPPPGARGTVPTHYPPQPGGPAAFWTVEIGSETLRPGGVAAVRLWARQGKLRPEDRVRRGDGPWQAAREIPELASLFPRTREAKRVAAPRSAADARRGWLSGLLGGAGALLPVMALLIFSGEFERLGAAWGAANGITFLVLCSAVLFTGALTGRALAYLQAHYDKRGEAADVWSAGGALKVGGCIGLAAGLPAVGLWPSVGLFKLLIFFAVYGVCLAFLTLLCYRWLFVERRA